MKEAVVFILDASPSMNSPYPSAQHFGNDADVKLESSSAETSSTRLTCAKRAIVGMICELMLQSKQNEVCVIVCKTRDTRHHKIAAGVDIEEQYPNKGDIPYPNLTELTDGVTRPSIELLQQIMSVETITMEEAGELQGDFCDGIILAADALYERTHHRKYQRKIVLLTDAAGYDVVMDAPEILVVLDSLREMECHLDVIGLNFMTSGEFERPAAPSAASAHTSPRKRVKTSTDDETETTDEGTRHTRRIVKKEYPDEDNESEPLPQQLVYSTKLDREKLLLSLTEKTGGRIVAAKSIQEVLDANKGRRIQTATKRKAELHIAPGLMVEIRYLLMMKKEGYPTLRTEATVLDEHGQVRLNSLGQEITDRVVSVIQYVDDEHPDDLVAPDQITHVFRYGTDVVLMNTHERAGIKAPSNAQPRIDILGYVERNKIPKLYMMGPPYALSGHDSMHSCAAIAALAQALDDLNMVAVATFHKTKDSEPILGALFPLDEPNYPFPIHLMFLQLPYAGDVKRLNLASFEKFLNGENADSAVKARKTQACDNLIDALMLPDDVLASGSVPSPFLRSWNQTKIERAIDPKAAVVKVRTTASHDPMSLPPDIMAQSRPALAAYRDAFPLTLKKVPKPPQEAGRAKGRKVLNFSDYL